MEPMDLTAFFAVKTRAPPAKEANSEASRRGTVPSLNPVFDQRTNVGAERAAKLQDTALEVHRAKSFMVMMRDSTLDEEGDAEESDGEMFLIGQCVDSDEEEQAGLASVHARLANKVAMQNQKRERSRSYGGRPQDPPHSPAAAACSPPYSPAAAACSPFNKVLTALQIPTTQGSRRQPTPTLPTRRNSVQSLGGGPVLSLRSDTDAGDAPNSPGYSPLRPHASSVNPMINSVGDEYSPSLRGGQAYSGAEPSVRAGQAYTGAEPSVRAGQAYTGPSQDYSVHAGRQYTGASQARDEFVRAGRAQSGPLQEPSTRGGHAYTGTAPARDASMLPHSSLKGVDSGGQPDGVMQVSRSAKSGMGHLVQGRDAMLAQMGLAPPAQAARTRCNLVDVSGVQAAMRSASSLIGNFGALSLNTGDTCSPSSVFERRSDMSGVDHSPASSGTPKSGGLIKFGRRA